MATALIRALDDVPRNDLSPTEPVTTVRLCTGTAVDMIVTHASVVTWPNGSRQGPLSEYSKKFEERAIRRCLDTLKNPDWTKRCLRRSETERSVNGETLRDQARHAQVRRRGMSGNGPAPRGAARKGSAGN